MPLSTAPDYLPSMRGQLVSLQKVFDSLLAPIEGKLAAFPIGAGARGTDPVWQIGHAGHDASHALLRPFAPEHPLLFRFGDAFHGRRVGEPWQARRPDFAAVRAWWTDILAAARAHEHLPSEPLPAPIVFTAYSVSTTAEAWDYVLFHTSFHLGRAYELLRTTATP